MHTTIDWLAMLFLITSSIGLGYGIDLKKWHGWAYVLSGFMLGIMVGVDTESVISATGLATGVFFALLLIWLGPIMLRRRQR